MFEYLKEHRSIIVTGPQRAGTRIAAKMIASDTSYKYIDEKEIKIDSLYRAARFIKTDGIVLQCPALSKYAHLFKDVLVVFMMRSIDDIIVSQNRIDWDDTVELMRYEKEGIVSQIKYEYWEEQKLKTDNYLEINYEDLKGHHLWIEKTQRINFKPFQTNV
jgi:hypothetical protein